MLSDQELIHLLQQLSNYSSSNNQSEVSAEVREKIFSSFDIERTNCRTFLIIVAVCNKGDNRFHNIDCGGSCHPIEGYCYDKVTNTYMVECHDYWVVGNIPINFILKSKTSDWMCDFPLPIEILENNMTTTQLEDMNNFKKRYDHNYSFEFVQMVVK